tara:strand:+ start:448 stop:618 length:171 start_codon:yes stop_codon:yes gene_type:complete
MNAKSVTETMAEDDNKRGYPSDMHRRQRSKNWTMLSVLVGLVVLFYVVALVRMGGG